ncbi:MAG: hypothetical protein HYY50_03290 [Candidatus Kerfeldbacteria bacterium]|nr:hypothetical protein [Candidatus Kerfeldbacteria bacterium]
MKNFIIVIISVIVVGLVSFFAISSWRRDQNTNGNQNANVSQSGQNWDSVVAAARQTESYSFGGFTFAMPVNMMKSVGEGGVTWTFPVQATDSPHITFTQPGDTAANLVNMEKTSLAPGMRVVREGTEVIHGQEWRYLEVTTNFDLNYTYWFSEHQSSVQVMYTEGLPEVMTVLEKIILSAQLQ